MGGASVLPGHLAQWMLDSVSVASGDCIMRRKMREKSYEISDWYLNRYGPVLPVFHAHRDSLFSSYSLISWFLPQEPGGMVHTWSYSKAVAYKMMYWVFKNQLSIIKWYLKQLGNQMGQLVSIIRGSLIPCLKFVKSVHKNWLAVEIFWEVMRL